MIRAKRKIWLLAPLCVVLTGPVCARAATPAGAPMDEIRQAIDEERYIDAERAMDQQIILHGPTAELVRLKGDLALAQSHYGEALGAYQISEKDPTQRLRSLEGEGLALLQVGRADVAAEKLNAVVTADEAAWRAWNGLGVIADQKGDWAGAAQAYQKALASSAGNAGVLNNRGYSRLLQHCFDDAEADFRAALSVRPGLKAARKNLEYAQAMRPIYASASFCKQEK